MEDSRVFGSTTNGVRCEGDMKATRCTVEHNASSGVYVSGEHASAELVDCVVCKNKGRGVFVYMRKTMLRGGMISESSQGVCASSGGKVKVAKAEEGKPQTVSKGGLVDYTQDGISEIIGIPQEKINT